MHSEHFQISENVLQELLEMKKQGNPVIAVGTTVVRVLESLAQEGFQQFSGWTDIFIYPPYEFQMVANSTPIAPPPIMITDLGNLSCNMASL